MVIIFAFCQGWAVVCLHIQHLVAKLTNFFRGCVTLEGHQQPFTVGAAFDQRQRISFQTRV